MQFYFPQAALISMTGDGRQTGIANVVSVTQYQREKKPFRANQLLVCPMK